MSKFKAGDKVRVVSAPGGSSFGYLSEGSEHTVGNVRDGYVHLKGHTEDGWCDFRFELIEAAPKRDYVADHARRTLRAAGLSKDEAAKFVASLAKAGQNWDVKLSQLSRKLPGPLSDVIRGAFSWSDSAEGQAYWEAIANREEEKEQAAHA